jgi:flagellar protein FliJ
LTVPRRFAIAPNSRPRRVSVTRFEFPLDRLLSLKRQLLRRAEADQAKARRDVDEARAAAIAARAELDREAERTNGALGTAVSAHDWQAATGRVERLGRVFAEREAGIARAAQAYEAAERTRSDLAREVDSFATLRERRLDEWRREAAKSDQDRLDEIGVRRWTSTRAAGVEGAVSP